MGCCEANLSTVESAVEWDQLALEGPYRGISQERWSVLVLGHACLPG